MSRDRHAAQRIRELRIDRGWTPEALSYEIAKLSPRYAVSGRTIRRIEREGAVPTVRVMFGIAAVFGLAVTDLWIGIAAVFGLAVTDLWIVRERVPA